MNFSDVDDDNEEPSDILVFVKKIMSTETSLKFITK